MKELSIKEKAKRYDEALQRTRKWYNSNTNEGYIAIFEDIFSDINSYNQFYGICMEIAEMVQEEPVSDDLEKAGKEWLTPQLDKSYADYGETKMMELTRFDGYAMLDAIEFGAQWQKKQMISKDNSKY